MVGELEEAGGARGAAWVERIVLRVLDFRALSFPTNLMTEVIDATGRAEVLRQDAAKAFCLIPLLFYPQPQPPRAPSPVLYYPQPQPHFCPFPISTFVLSPAPAPQTNSMA